MMFERVLTEVDFEKVYPILAQSFPETELRPRKISWLCSKMKDTVCMPSRMKTERSVG